MLKFAFLTKNVDQKQPQNTFMVPWQCWSGVIKPKIAFSVA